MKTSKILISTFVAAAAMNLPALGLEIGADGYTVSSDQMEDQVYFGASAGALTVNSGATLTVSGSTTKEEGVNASAADRSSFSVGNAGSATINVNGTLNVLNAEGFGGTWAGFGMTIGEGGVANLKKLSLSVQYYNNSSSSVILQSGGTLNLGAGGYVRDYGYHAIDPDSGMISLTLNGGTLGALDSWSTSTALTTTGTVTLNTTKYDASSAAYASEGATITASGGLAGTGKFIVSGIGTVSTTDLSVSSVEVQKGASLTISGSVSSDVSITSNGNLELTSSGTLNGHVTVSEGTFSVAGTVASTANISVSNNGTVELTSSGTLSGHVTVSEGTFSVAGTVASTANISVSNNGSVSVANTAVFDLADGETSHTFITGDGITGWDQLGRNNVTIDGLRLGRQTVDFSTAGTVTISEAAAANLVWNGGTSSRTWDVETTQNWTNSGAGAADAFYTRDNVTFSDSASSKTVTLANGSDITVGTMTVESGTYTLESSTGAAVSGSTLTIASGASLTAKTIDLGFDDIAVAGTLTLNSNSFSSSSALSWSQLTFQGGTFDIYDTQSNANFLTIDRVVMDGDGAITSTWSYTPGNPGNSNTPATPATLTIGSLSGAGNLSITGSKQNEPINYVIGTIASDFSGTISISKSTETTAATVALTVNSSGLNLGENTKFAVGAGTTLALDASSAAGELSLANITSAAGSVLTIKANSSEDTFTKITSFGNIAGTLNVSGGFLNLSDPSGINQSSIEKIVLSGGRESGLCFVRGQNLTVSKDIVAEGENGGALRSYAKDDYTVEFTGSVTGTKIRHYDGGTHTFSGNVDLTEFEAAAGKSVFKGASTSLEKLSGSANVIKTGSGTMTVTGASTFTGNISVEGGVLDVTASGATLFAAGSWVNNKTVTVKSGAELKVASLAYGGSLGNLSHYTARRVLDGGKITVTTTSNAQGITVNAAGGTIEAAAGATVTFIGDSNGTQSALDLAGTLRIGGDGNITVKSGGTEKSVIGSGSLLKFGSGTLTLSNANTFTGGTEIETGTLSAGNTSALGTGPVKISGGQLSVAQGVALNLNSITVVLGGAYDSADADSVAAIVGAGTLSLADGAKITLTKAAEEAAAALVAETSAATFSYKIFEANSTLASSFSLDDFVFGEEWADLQYRNYDSTAGILTLSMIPEPSAFGLLAGAGALALCAARRRRNKR